ncbi:MAG: DUF1573 domain-containing protein [Planctomycetaceae bacterium]|nr:DUF1573 domain-containing protein [Planctomycetaceae bacterium]
MNNYLKKSSLVLIIFYLPFMLGCVSKPVIVGGIHVSPNILDLGNVSEEQPIEGVFKIVNNSGKAVNINNIVLSCGCSDLILNEKTIPANGSVEAKLIVEAKGGCGQDMFEAKIITDNPITPAVKLILIANIIAKHPDGAILINLGSFDHGAKIDQTFETLPGKIKSVVVQDVQYDPPTLSPKKFNITAETLEYEKVKLNINGTAPEDDVNFTIIVTLKAEGALWETARIRFSGNIYQYIHLPFGVYLGFLKNGESTVKKVDFTCPAEFLTKNQIDKIIIKDQLPEILQVKLIKTPQPHLEFNLKHSGKVETFSQDMKIEVYMSNGKKYLLSTNVAARFL